MIPIQLEETARVEGPEQVEFRNHFTYVRHEILDVQDYQDWYLLTYLAYMYGVPTAGS
jgi:hypothetical protein